MNMKVGNVTCEPAGKIHHHLHRCRRQPASPWCVPPPSSSSTTMRLVACYGAGGRRRQLGEPVRGARVHRRAQAQGQLPLCTPQATVDGAGGREDEQLRLLGAWPSPFVIRVRVALHLKGLEYDYLEEDITNKSELLLASNPFHNKVPVLLHGGRPVCESLVIMQYLDDAFPGASGQAILPADPYDRAVARFWVTFMDNKLFPPMIQALMGSTEEERATSTADMFVALETLESAFAELSGGKGFFAGDAPGYVDVVLGSFVHWLRAWDKLAGLTVLDAGRIPLLAAWARRFAALEAAKEVLPDTDRIVEFAKRLKARRTPAAAARLAARN